MYLIVPYLAQRVMYHIGYCLVSFVGFQWSYFYFSIHLLDLILESKRLITVLNSLLINGKQVSRWMLATVVVGGVEELLVGLSFYQRITFPPPSFLLEVVLTCTYRL